MAQTVASQTPGGDGVLALRSREAITAALYQLMERDDYHALTITQICQEAGIARQTFYHHFQSKGEILSYDFHRAFLDYTRRYPDGGMGENLRNLFQDFPVSRRKLLLLKKQGIFHSLEACMTDFLSDRVPAYHFEELLGRKDLRPYQNRFIVSTLAAILSCWIDQNFRESPQELSEIAVQLLSGSAGADASKS